MRVIEKRKPNGEKKVLKKPQLHTEYILFEVRCVKLCLCSQNAD